MVLKTEKVIARDNWLGREHCCYMGLNCASATGFADTGFFNDARLI